MNDWTAGYVADIGYTYGYYNELNPQRARLALLRAGYASPTGGAVCELGFGQGVSANIHGAAQPGTMWGTDFNPSQAHFAQNLAASCGSGARLFDQSFSEFCTRDDLPEFDSIGLHGIWSWISDENRAVIVDFIRRKLKVGGVVYASYNSLPGWAQKVPMRELMVDYTDVMAAPGRTIVDRIGAALDFAEQLVSCDTAFARANPWLPAWLEHLKRLDRNYLAHEYFNRDWQPMSFARMASWLGSAKLDYACSAAYLEDVAEINLTPEQRQLLGEIPDPMFRQTMLDFCINRQFRRDYWIKGGRQLGLTERTDRLRAERVILTERRADVSLSVTGRLGEGTLNEDVYGPVLDALADGQPRTLGEIESAVDGAASLGQIVEAAMILIGKGAMQIAQPEAVVGDVRPHTDHLNATLLDHARGGMQIGYLASPVTGGGIAVSWSHQIFLLALLQGEKDPGAWAKFAWQLMEGQGQRLVKGGEMLESAESNLDELRNDAKGFSEHQLPILCALQLI
ncbi:methyltransferase [Burkholderia metallica]|uniref:class I SAM-dependent methyltransferase n=1 Tax=Burkholderia metallica TaxID=488729 RepID=UPI00157ABCBA|nr:class I SAM-dependent methyltransferase [Burkholderia metallica]NTZ88891.1 methyltransferase [Burkholderia metallica]